MIDTWVFEKSKLCPKDAGHVEQYEEFKGYYKTKYDIAKKHNPKNILEIGVRAGYSAYSFLSAAPDAKYTGIDMEHGGYGGPWTWWARDILKDFNNVEFIKADSLRMESLPGGPYDMIHVDGDHSYLGAIHDMNLCWKSLSKGGLMLIDDYDFIKEVKDAVDKWSSDNPSAGKKYIKSIRGEILFYKNI